MGPLSTSRSSISTAPTPPFFRPGSTVPRLMGANADALLLFVPVAGDAPASSVAVASARRPRLARPENDGGNNAGTYDNRTDAPDSNRAVRAGSADHEPTAGFPGRLGRTRKRAPDPRQYPPGSRAAIPCARLAQQSPCRGTGRGERLAHMACGRTNAGSSLSQISMPMAHARDSKRASAVGTYRPIGLFLPHPIQSAAAHWERVSPSYRRIEARCEASGAWTQSKNRVSSAPNPERRGALGTGEPSVPAHRGSMRSIRPLGSIKNREACWPLAWRLGSLPRPRSRVLSRRRPGARR